MRVRVKSGVSGGVVQPVAPISCPHLGPAIERDGVTVKVKCGCNGKEQERPHAAHECAIYRRCLPTLVPVDLAAWRERKPESDIFHLCHGCTDREFTSPPQPPSLPPSASRE